MCVNETKSFIKIKTPEIAATGTLNGILMEDNLNNKFDGFKIFLSNRESASFFNQLNFNIEGSPLEAAADPPGYNLYILKLAEKFHIEKDPLYKCKDYSHYGDYDACLEKMYILQTRDIMNCTPPWLTDKQDVWCFDNLRLSKDKTAELDLLLDSIMNNQANLETKLSCPISCRETK